MKKASEAILECLTGENPKEIKIESKEETLTLAEARNMGVVVKGQEILVKNMSEAQLVALSTYDKNPRLANACRLELEFRLNEQG